MVREYIHVSVIHWFIREQPPSCRLFFSLPLNSKLIFIHHAAHLALPYSNFVFYSDFDHLDGILNIYLSECLRIYDLKTCKYQPTRIQLLRFIFPRQNLFYSTISSLFYFIFFWERYVESCQKWHSLLRYAVTSHVNRALVSFKWLFNPPPHDWDSFLEIIFSKFTNLVMRPFWEGNKQSRLMLPLLQRYLERSW